MGLATIYQTAQIGAETVTGTNVAASQETVLVSASRFRPNPDISIFRAAGNKYPSVAALNREWTELDMDGAITYTEICLLALRHSGKSDARRRDRPKRGPSRPPLPPPITSRPTRLSRAAPPERTSVTTS